MTDVGKAIRSALATARHVAVPLMRAKGGPVTDPAAPQTPAMWQNPNFQKWFNGSKVVNGQGQPDTLYHGTAGDFDVFKQRRNDIGMHFGTIGQANDRLSYQRDLGAKPLDGMNLMPVHLAIRNPLRMKDLGNWSGDGLAWALGKEFPAESEWISRNVRTPTQARKFLQSKGHDGVVYKNTGEVGGSEPYRAAIKDATTELHKHFPKNKNYFDYTDQRHPAYQAWRSAHDKYREHRENNAEDSYIAFEPHQVKSALGNNGEFDPRNPSIVRADGGPAVDGGVQPRSDPATPPVAPGLAPTVQKKPSIAPPVQQPRVFNGAGMYSHAAEEALRLPQVRGNPQQMLASLKGVKKEELDNAGSPVGKYADPKSITREELARHFRNSVPRIHESEFSDDNDPGEEGDDPQETQYKEYAIPGGKNYRELLLHLPPTPVPPPTPEMQKALQKQHDTWRAVNAHRAKHRGSEAELHADPQFLQLTEAAEAAQRVYSGKQQAHFAEAKDKDFHSSHWSTPNVLAHLRLSDRPVPVNESPGQLEKATHLEELQSDWGQRGREKGFRDSGFDPASARRQIESTLSEETNGKPGQGREVRDALRTKLKQHESRVPNGPYVTSTNGWTDLGLKRALLEAARAGHNRLVWTPDAEHDRMYPGRESTESHEGGGKGYYDKIVPLRMREILKKLGHEARFEPVTVTHEPKDGSSPGPHNTRTTLHSLHLPPELRDKIKKGLPAFAKGGAVKSGGAASSRAYPLAPRSEWYGDANYEGTGGSLSWMPPARYLAQVRPLKIDETSRDNIDSLKDHIQSGRTLDPLAIYANGMEDGRHRAHAAHELNIAKVPVLTWPQKHAALTQKPHYLAAGGAAKDSTVHKGPLKLALLATEANRTNPLGKFNPGVVDAAQANNDMERMAKEHGYSGVANPKAAYPIAALFNKTPVQPTTSDDSVAKALRLTAPAA